jgi:hypothetical protein
MRGILYIVLNQAIKADSDELCIDPYQNPTDGQNTTSPSKKMQRKPTYSPGFMLLT